ncbi:MAG: hypothetical protein GY818_15955 [Planctomycetaceae bacterium]|nr:hypothetical protein [Planctomycetaceae bacterium]
MSLFDDLINYEIIFPGAISGSTDICCPHCDTSLTVPVDDPMGEESYQCCECGGGFDVDWAAWTVTPWQNVELQINFDIGDED